MIETGAKICGDIPNEGMCEIQPDPCSIPECDCQEWRYYCGPENTMVREHPDRPAQILRPAVWEDIVFNG